MCPVLSPYEAPRCLPPAPAVLAVAPRAPAPPCVEGRGEHALAAPQLAHQAGPALRGLGVELHIQGVVQHRLPVDLHTRIQHIYIHTAHI